MDTTNSYSQMVSCGQEPFSNRQQFTYRTASNRWMPYAVPTDRLHGYVDDTANLSYQTLYGYESPGDYNNRDFVNSASVYNQQQQQQSVIFQQNEAYSMKSTACTSWLNNNTTAVENANSQNNASSSSRSNSRSSSNNNNNNSNKRALSHMHTMAGQPEMRRRRLAANERERRRMNSLNGAFDNLRNVLPSIESGKNLSKIETLLMAQEYIRVLQELIGSNK